MSSSFVNAFKSVVYGIDDMFYISKSPYRMKLKLKHPHLFANNRIITVYAKYWPYLPSATWMYKMLLSYPVSNIDRIRRFKSKWTTFDDRGHIYSSPHIELFFRLNTHNKNVKKRFVSEIALYGLLLAN